MDVDPADAVDDRTDKSSCDEHCEDGSSEENSRERSGSVERSIVAESDAEALDRFCEELEASDAFTSDQLDFDRWQALASVADQPLDITLPVWISSLEAKCGGKKAVPYSYQDLGQTFRGKLPPRKKTLAEICVPENARDGQCIKIPGAGDIRGTERGDLHVIIRVRREP